MADIPYALKLLATNVQRLIDERGLSQADVARGIGKSGALITQLLNAAGTVGKGKRISRVSIDTVDDLAIYFEVPHATLFADPKTAPAMTLRPIERDVVTALRKADRPTRQGIGLFLGVDIEKL